MFEIPAVHFFMLRHGESDANARKVYAGQMDSPLTELGRAQADKVSHIMPQLEVKPQTVIHSHLSRAIDTAKPSAKALGLQTLEDPKWAEQHFGDWQGVAHEEVMAQRTAGVTPPNGESNDEFRDRIVQAAVGTFKQYERPLIVCHGGCFRALAEHYSLPAIRVQNTTLYEFIPQKDPAVFPWTVYRYDRETGEKCLDDHFTANNVTKSAHPQYLHE